MFQRPVENVLKLLLCQYYILEASCTNSCIGGVPRPGHQLRLIGAAGGWLDGGRHGGLISHRRLAMGAY